MTDFVPKENSVVSRNAATANFLIDSDDRLETIYPSPGDFVIAAKASLLNGYFTRIAVQEVCLNWGVPNIDETLGNNTLSFTVSGTTYTATLNTGNYTVAQALTALVAQMNTVLGGSTFSLQTGTNPPLQAIVKTGATFTINATTTVKGVFSLANMLNLPIGVSGLASALVQSPYLMPYSYIDFIANSLTYNQALKDGSTNAQNPNRDVLYRWNFSSEDQVAVDTAGYPIFPGYLPFNIRRCIPFPKQSRWEPNMPLGQLTFQVFDPYGNLLNYTDYFSNGVQPMSWRMNLLISEN